MQLDAGMFQHLNDARACLMLPMLDDAKHASMLAVSQLLLCVTWRAHHRVCNFPQSSWVNECYITPSLLQHTRQPLSTRCHLTCACRTADAHMLTPAQGAVNGGDEGFGGEQQAAVMLPLTPAGGGTGSPPAAHSPGFSDMGVRCCRWQDQEETCMFALS